MRTRLRQVKAVVFDWAGTVVDHGSLGAVGVFVEAFAEFGVAITVDEARQPMGIGQAAARRRPPRHAADRRGVAARAEGTRRRRPTSTSSIISSCPGMSPSRRVTPTDVLCQPPKTH